MEAAARLREDEAQNKVIFFAVGVGAANMDRLAQVVCRPPVKIEGLNFVDMFMWLSKSMENAAQNKFDQQVPLPGLKSFLNR